MDNFRFTTLIGTWCISESGKKVRNRTRAPQIRLPGGWTMNAEGARGGGRSEGPMFSVIFSHNKIFNKKKWKICKKAELEIKITYGVWIVHEGFVDWGDSPCLPYGDGAPILGPRCCLIQNTHVNVYPSLFDYCPFLRRGYNDPSVILSHI